MLPGFTGLSTYSRGATAASDPAVRLAGLWDIPSQKTCRFARTDTFCTLAVLWCKEVYVCDTPGIPEIFGHEESRTPYPCGVCVGISSPDDW